ncbi:MAG: sensor histidine kinase [Propionibacteriaceae bacterium]|nr:sensor histidine kinase [Propionibacteriaceae bacterium]
MAVAVFSVAAAATLLFVDLRIDLLSNPSEIVFHWLVFTIAWSFGYGLSALDRKAKKSMQRVLDVEIEAAERATAAVTEERTRIARELHDVVAHSVSVMVVQAGAAQQMVDDDPEYVRAALDTIRTTGTEALSEMRRVVEMLRVQDESGALAPQPGAASVSALVEDARVGGLDVSLLVEGEPRQLPAGLDLAVYRIVQEALTNVRRHAAASTASVVLRYGSDDVELEVRDDGAGVPSSPEVAGGHGLIGMRERAALYGGHLETVSGNGYTVRAVLPVAPA